MRPHIFLSSEKIDMEDSRKGSGRNSSSGLRHRSSSIKSNGSTSGPSSKRSSLVKAKEMMDAAIAKIGSSEKPIDPEKEPDFAARNPFWEEPLPDIHHDEDMLTNALVFENKSKKLDAVPLPQKDESHLSDSYVQARNKWRNAYLKVKKDLVIRNQALRSAVGTGAEVEGLSFGLWDKYSPSRAHLFHFLYNQTTEYFILALILLHVVIIILRAYIRAGVIFEHITENTLYMLDAVLTGIFSVECIARIACLGLWRGPKTYLRNMYNQIDLISVLDSIAQLLAERYAKRYEFFRILILRLFRGLLSLREIGFFAQVLAIFEALQKSMEPLQDVLLLSIVLLFFYALVGLQFFGSDLNYRCLRKSDLQISYPVVYCSHFSDRGFKCPSDQVCKKVGGNPGYGLLSFDKFPYAFLTLFQVITLEGWSFVMYVMQDVEFTSSVAYFVTLIVIVTYLLINIVIAAISGVFLRVRHEHQALLKKNRDEQQFNIYNATVIASILKDALKAENKKLTCRDLFKRKAEEVKAKIDETMKITNLAMQRAISKAVSPSDASHSQTTQGVNGDFDWDPEGRTRLSREFSHSIKHGMTRALTHRAKKFGERVNTKCKAILASKYFNYIELFAIGANMIVLCLYYEGMSKKLLYAIYALESIFLIIFTLQMAVRFLSGGFSRFIDDKMNVFDTLVIAVSAGAIMSRSYPNISGARILRFFYNSKKERPNQKSNIVGDCLDGLSSMGAVAFFFLLIVFTFSVIGMELYAGEYNKFEDTWPRDNFDTIFKAMFSWFMCTTTDNWPYQMWTAARPEIPNRWIGPFLYVVYFIITVFLVLNLVIAVILENTELSDEQKKSIQKEIYLKQLRARQTHLLKSRGRGTWLIAAVEKTSEKVKSVSKRFNTKKIKSISIPADISEMERGSVSKPDHSEEVHAVRFPGQATHVADAIVLSSSGLQLTMEASGKLNSQPSARALPSVRSSRTSNSLSGRANQILLGSGFSASIAKDQQPNTALRNSILALVKPHVSFKPETPSEVSREDRIKEEANNMSFSLQEYEDLTNTFKLRDEYPWYLSDDALFVFSLENPIRIACQRIVEHFIFRWYMIAVVIVSVAALMCMKQEYILPNYIVDLNIFVFVAFLVEFILKVIAYGFLFTPDSYLGDPYNFLDLFLLIIDGLNVIPSWDPTQVMYVRMIDSLRPLRILCHIPGMRIVTSNLLRTIPAVSSVLVFTFAVFAVFAVIGVQMFKGRFSKCNEYVEHRAYCVQNAAINNLILGPRVWEHPQYHFDDFPTALLSLFILSTFDNVQDGFVYTVMDIRGPLGTQPTRDESPNNSLFFIVFLCIGGFFVLRMFVGVFIDQFGLISGSKLLTERQKLLRDTNRIIQHLKPLRKPRVPLFRIQRIFYLIVTSPKYGATIRIIVLVNYIWLATHFAGQPVWLTNSRNIVEVTFASFYCLDVIVKIIGLDVRDFVRDPWNLFELGIAVFSETMIMPTTLSIRKTLGRIPMGARIFRVIRYTPRLNTLLGIVIVSMTHMLDIIFLLVILLITFSVVGVQYFGSIREGSCVGMDMNFSSFGTAFITLFQILTSDNWSCIMADSQTEFPYCTLDHPIYGDDCGGSAFAIIYFLIFIIIATNVFMNMFVAIIIDTITFGLLKEKTIITPENLTEYQVLWQDSEFDPDSEGYIHFHKLRSFLNRLDAPLGRRHNAPMQWYARIEWEVLSFHVPDKGIPFRELLETLALYKIGSRGLELALRIEREKQVQIIYKNGAASKIQAAVRGFLVRTGKSKPNAETNAETSSGATKTNAMLFE